MQGYNAILVYDFSDEQILFCHRVKEPYKGKYNFVGGKIEEMEDGSKEEGFASAYRELYEETGITRADIELFHLMDFTYYSKNFHLEIYAGRLIKEVTLVEEKNPLRWIDKNENFFDTTRFAGDGNIGHIVRVAEDCGFGVRENEREK